MQELGFTEADWKLFRKRLPEWQERYMEKLIEEYKVYLSSDEPASSKFWGMKRLTRLPIGISAARCAAGKLTKANLSVKITNVNAALNIQL